MKNIDSDISGPAPKRRHGPLWIRILNWIDIAVISIIAFVVLGVCLATWLLTPERLTRIVNREASEYLDADVRASNVRFTIWSTFPRFTVELDSLTVRSRTLDSVAPAIARQLPDSADFLLSTGRIRGGINVLKLLHKDIWLRDVVVASLRVNLLAVNDSVNNYDIVPATGKGTIPEFYIDGMKLVDSGFVRYRSIASLTDASLALKGASLVPAGMRDTYRMKLSGTVTAESDGLTIFRRFPIELGGDVHVRFRPFGISTDDYHVQLGEVNGHVSMDMQIGDNMQLNNFNYKLRGFTINDLLEMLPVGNYPELKRLDANLPVDVTARLTSAYDFSSGELPSAEVDFRIGNGDLTYTLSDGRSYRAEDVGMDGRFVFDGDSPEASYIVIPRLYARGEGVSLDATARISQLTGNPRVDVNVSAVGELEKISRQIVEMRPYRLTGKLGVDAGLRFEVADGSVDGTLLNVRLSSERMGMAYGPYGVSLTGFEAETSESYERLLTKNSLADIPLNLQIGVKGAKISEGATEMRLRGLAMQLKASRLSRPLAGKAYKAPAKWSDDARTLAFAPHSPEILQVKLADTMKDFMAKWGTQVELRLKDVEIHNDGYPAENHISDVNLAASFDTISLRHATFSSGQTRGDMAMRVTNLRQFLTSPTPAPVNVDVSLDIDTVQINQLARIWAEAHPESAIARGDKEAMGEGIDTVSMILPRNINARIHATAKQTRYINLHLYDLMTDLRLSDGRLDVDTLHLSADFGEAALRFAYDTANMQDMGMSLFATVYDIDVTRFFRNFPKLLEMMPSMANLSGELSADITARVKVFPNMYLMVPSLWADAHVNGHDLELKQNKFIHHVTNMLMLRGYEPIRIADIGVHAGVHSNLLEVFPFTFEMSKYKLRLCGLNNFAGDLYYHIGVEDWPLKIPFGVNIKGDYHHPVLRFGGKDWKDKNGAMITAGVEDQMNINILREMRKMGGEFIHTAAVYKGK